MKKGDFPVRSVIKSPEGLTFFDELSPAPGVPQDEHMGFDFRRNKGWMATRRSPGFPDYKWWFNGG